VSDDRLNFVRERIEEALAGRSIETFCAESAGVFKRNTLRRWIKGETSPGIDDLAIFADMTGRDLSFFIPPSQPTAAVMVQKLDVRAAAGAGAVNEFAHVEEQLDFPEWMAKKLGVSRSQLRILRAHGDSMEPTIASGALLLVDEREDSRKPPAKGRRRPRLPPNDIFVFRIGSELRVKRIHAAKSGFVLISDNAEYDPEFIRGADRDGFRILGQVVWWCNWL
jgi:SOS-response transcriptional repressor LexA